MKSLWTTNDIFDICKSSQQPYDPYEPQKHANTNLDRWATDLISVFGLADIAWDGVYRSNFLDFFKSPSHGHSNSIWCVHTYWTPILGHFRDLDHFLGGVGSERGQLIFFWLIEFFPQDFQQYMTQRYLVNTIFGHFLAQEHFSGWAGGFGRSKYFWSSNNPLMAVNYCILYEYICFSSLAKKINKHTNREMETFKILAQMMLRMKLFLQMMT